MRPALGVGGLLALCAFARVAAADDGLLEIHQACAEGAGCFAGDGPGLPVVITSSGSYRLTSSLSVPTASTSAILVLADRVTIDLNGFALVGGTTCTGTPVVCTPGAGTGSGVSAVTQSRVVVRNGVVRGMGNHGLDLGPDARVEGVRARENRQDGISVGVASSIEGSTSERNGGDGIAALDRANVTACTSGDNGADGIVAGQASIVIGSTSDENQDGIDVAAGSVVSASTAHGNRSVGVRLGPGSVISASTSVSNTTDGISAGAGSTLLDNVARSNGGFGLVPGPNSGYVGNHVSANTGGAVSGGVQAGINACDAAVCP